ncbi:MAG TPA: trypsin-like peptidase domain-containing protein [Allosphingosinicella sp.]|nr:trypsin-like peptidase domain-containing protein [Allosphingosinicella sp.]
MSVGRFILLMLAVLAAALPAAPARADDISVAGRSVVRVVVISFGEEGEVTGFGHGSGFAVAPNRVVTNAHVIAQARQAEQEGRTVSIGVVPSQGAQASRARVVAFDPARDLALLEVEEGRLPPIPLYVGPLDDGVQIAALGYPGNVDLATARSADDYIQPLPPTRSVGIFSNVRPINGITTLLHTANIARGHSGGPLLDQCGRVLGVNTLITRNQDGDAPFAFAVANRELTAFLGQARQPYQSVTTPCVSMSDRLREDQERAAAEERARQQSAEAEARQAQQTRERSLAEITEMRENRLALSVLLLVFSLLAFGGCFLLVIKNRPPKYAKIMGGVGAGLLILAIIAFIARPSLITVEEARAAEAAPAPDRFAGANVCRLVQQRSRLTISSGADVPLDWSPTGCVNGRTQYAQDGQTWSRILISAEQPVVSVSEFRPATGEYVLTRYQLDNATMERIRAARRPNEPRSCSADNEARTILADQQRDIAAMLPRLPNERLVYSCENQRAGQSPAR